MTFLKARHMGQCIGALTSDRFGKALRLPIYTCFFIFLEESTCMIFVSVDEMTEEECAPVVQWRILFVLPSRLTTQQFLKVIVWNSLEFTVWSVCLSHTHHDVWTNNYHPFNRLSGSTPGFWTACCVAFVEVHVVAASWWIRANVYVNDLFKR